MNRMTIELDMNDNTKVAVIAIAAAIISVALARTLGLLFRK